MDEATESDQGTSETPSRPRLAVPLSSISVLVVDDHEANRFAFRTTLEPLGYSLFLASSGTEALALSSRYRFAVILLDVRMPGMDGLETATFLRKKPFTAETPIIFVSAYQDTVPEVSRLSLPGPIGFIHSPVDSDLLHWKVKQYVGLYLTNEQLKLRAEVAWQAERQLLERLKVSRDLPPDLRRSALRLSAALEDLREVISDRQAISPD